MAHKTNSIKEANQRSKMYQFLASLYLTEPTSQLICELGQLGVDEQTDLDGIKREFQNLFIIPLGQYTTPYEAVYRDEREVAGQKVRGLLMGLSTLDVIQQYKESGAKLGEEIKELPDHIGVELGFMKFLCEEEAKSLQQGDQPEAKDNRKRESRFLQEHLTKWISPLVEKIEQKARLNFYKQLARITEESIREDLKTIG